jgi:integrase
LLLACGLRRHEAVALRFDHLQRRDEHWAIVDLVGKTGHVRTVPVPDWVRSELDDWLAAAAIDRGRREALPQINNIGKMWGEGMTEKTVWHIVKESARTVGVAKLAPHLRRTCALLCHASGVSWSKSDFSWDTYRFKRLNATSAASSASVQQSMIALASSRILELAVGLRKGCRQPFRNNNHLQSGWMSALA